MIVTFSHVLFSTMWIWFESEEGSMRSPRKKGSHKCSAVLLLRSAGWLGWAGVAPQRPGWRAANGIVVWSVAASLSSKTKCKQTAGPADISTPSRRTEAGSQQDQQLISGDFLNFYFISVILIFMDDHHCYLWIRFEGKLINEILIKCRPGRRYQVFNRRTN